MISKCFEKIMLYEKYDYEEDNAFEKVDYHILQYTKCRKCKTNIYIYISSVNNFSFASASGGENHIVCSKTVFFRNGGNAKPEFYFKLLLRPWTLSHRVELSETNGK